jgi:glycosyltransferase involved in cell wall biosynthesis
VTETRLLSHRLLQIFNRYLEPGGEEAWVNNLEKSLGLPTCYFDSADWTRPGAPPFWSQALRMIRNPDALQKLWEMHEREKPQAWLIQNVFPTGSAAIYPEAKKHGIPIIQYVHNFRPFSVSGYVTPTDLAKIECWPRMFLGEVRSGSWRKSHSGTAWFATVLAIAHSLRWFDAVTVWIAISDFMRDQFIRAGIPSEKIFTLRHFWRPIADVTRTTDEDYYLFIGRLVQLKGILVLLDVWDRIFHEKGNAGPKLVIVGEGELEEKVRSRSKANPLIDFRGAVSRDEKHRLLSGMRALIAPSLCLESLGLVAYEAYDFAKPVLAARAGGLGEIVLHDRTGLLHEPGYANALFDHVMTLERESQKRTEFGRNGRRWLLENANEEQWRTRFNQIIEFAIAAKTSSPFETDVS